MRALDPAFIHLRAETHRVQHRVTNMSRVVMISNTVQFVLKRGHHSECRRKCSGQRISRYRDATAQRGSNNVVTHSVHAKQLVDVI